MANLNVERELGAIISTLERIEADVIENRRLNQILADQNNATTSKLIAVELIISEMQPVTEQFTRWKAVGTGVLLTLGVVFTILGVTMATISEVTGRVWRAIIG